MSYLTPRATMAEFWDWKLSFPARPRVALDLAEPADTPMRRLSAMELATLRPIVAASPVDPPTYSTAIEAALRIRVWAARGTLHRKSGRELAFDLQHWLFPASHAARYPYRGLELLRHVDATRDQHGVTVWVDTLRGDRYERSRLHNRIAELIRLDTGQLALT